MEDLSPFLEEHLDRLEFPAIAAAVMSHDEILAAGAVGHRKLGAETPVTLQDKFHIGSVTKSMTSLLAVMLATEGKIALTNRISDVLDYELRDDYEEVTLKMLLQHRSGLQAQAPPGLWEKAWAYSGTGAEQRAQFVPEVLMLQPEVTPGTKFLYSNLGYSVAGTMLEQKMDAEWEDLMREWIFKPLGMKSAGFGPPASPGEVDQPWGHTWRDGRLTVADRADNPAAIGPGGIVHCSVLDLARYAAFHLAIASGKVPELEPWKELLHTPPAGQNYAFGWVVLERKWAGRKALTHNGTNTMNYCVVWLAPSRDIGFIVMTNAGNTGTESNIQEGCDSVVAALIHQFLPQQ